MKKVLAISTTSVKCAILAATLTVSTGCASVGNFLNPFYDPPTDNALRGERNDHAISGGGSGGTAAVKARTALESMANYQRAHDPQPVNPVINPAIVRLMWVPDHLSPHGDLVPAHYYYLKVKDDQWALQDAFDINNQLNSSTHGQTSNIPYVYADDSQ